MKPLSFLLNSEGGPGSFLAKPLLISMFCFALTGVAAEYRVWTGSNGVKMEAALVRQPGETLVLRTREGQLITTMRSSLSDADQRYLASLAEAGSAATPDAPNQESSPAERTQAAEREGGEADPGAFDALAARLEDGADLTERSDIARRILITALKNGRGKDGMEILSNFVVREFKARSGVLQKQKIEILSGVANGVACLDVLQGQALRPDIVDWLFESRDRLDILASHLTKEDELREVIHIVETLYDHDPRNRDTFFNLILAMALVWDQPRPRMHGQMGSTGIPYEADIVSRYDHFRGVYSTSSGRPLYSRLGVLPLCFTVDTPAPVAELQWVLTNVRGNLSSWHEKFSEINYDHPRIDSGAYSWPHGPYTLASIREHGGICVDQAYFAAMTARAHGLPAIYFSGEGRRGGHAWFAYLKSKTEWALDIGRYAYDRYATGFAVDPQTNKRMTDHDVAYSCDYALRSRAYDAAHSYVCVASILLEHGEYDQALSCAQSARELVKGYELPWNIEIDVLLRQEKPEMAVRLLDEKARFFSRYADITTAAREQQAGLLRKMGRAEEADRILDRHLQRVDDGRDDLAHNLVFKRVEELVQRGDVAGARDKLEELLKDQEREGQKLFAVIEKYLNITGGTDQVDEAARFLKRFIGECVRRSRGAREQRAFLEFLLRAHENNGDERSAERTRRELQRN